jgi:excisionase family DNA binding protein
MRAAQLEENTAAARALRPPGLAPELTTIEEAAAILGCGRTKAFALRAEGKLKAARSFGRRALVTTASVEACKAEMLCEPVPRRRRRAKPSSLDELNATFAALRGRHPGTQPVRSRRHADEQKRPAANAPHESEE